MNNFTVSIIVPCFNEEENIFALTKQLVHVLGKYENYELLFIDDGSTDKTLEHIRELSKKNCRIKYISFSRNFGHQKALKAGFDHATGQCVISIDSDLQHPVGLIDQMIEKWQQRFEVVYGIRESTSSLPIFKRLTSKLFYNFISLISDTPVHKDAADFRLMDRVVVDVLKGLDERTLFIRGMTSWIGFKQCSVGYHQNKRLAGKTKYSTKKMISLALKGITSFSVKPLHIATFLGLVISSLSFSYGLFAVIAKIFTNKTVPGWTSVMVSVLFIGGLQLVMLGILGEYVGKLFIESKKRPNYVIKESKL